MKTKIILMAALLGVAAMSANAGFSFGVSIGLPLPVVVSTPVVCAPVTVVQAVPACPDVNYVWAPGYWSYRPTGRVWMSGGWYPRPVYYARGYDHDRNGYRR
jgi:hypothetical protein